VVTLPEQTVDEPVIVPGDAITVTVADAEQPELASVYDMIVVPTDTPATAPDELTDPTDGLVVLHVPPPGDVVREVVDPTHMVREPVKGLGVVSTVTVRVAVQPPAIV